MKIYFCYIFLFLFGFTFSQKLCVDDPTVKKYGALVSSSVDVQYTSMCAALAIYKCECESGNLNASGVGQTQKNIAYVETNLKSAYSNNISQAGKGDAMLWRATKCKVGSSDGNMSSESSSSKNTNSELINAIETTAEVINTTANFINKGQAFFKANDELAKQFKQEHIARWEPRMQNWLSEYIIGYSYNIEKYAGERVNGIPNGRGKMNVVICENYGQNTYLCEVFDKEELSRYHMLKGSIDGEWKDGVPVSGEFSNTEKNYFDLRIKFEEINGWISKEGIIFFDKLVNSTITLKNKLPDGRDSVVYQEHFDKNGKLISRNKTSSLLSYTATPLPNSTIENYTVLLNDGTKIKSIMSYNIDAEGRLEFKVKDSVDMYFRNGDKYSYLIKSNDPEVNGIYYSSNGIKTNGINNVLKKQESNDVKDNYYSFIMTEQVMNPATTKSGPAENRIKILIKSPVYSTQSIKLQNMVLDYSTAPQNKYGWFQRKGPYRYKYGMSPYSVIRNRGREIDYCKNEISIIYQFIQYYK